MSKTQALNKLMIVIGLLFVLLVTLQTHAAPATPVHHKMTVELHPGLRMLKVQDVVTFPKDTPRKLSFLLHKDLQISLKSADDTLILLHAASGDEIFSEYGLELGGSDLNASFQYQGIVYDPVVEDNSRGLISADGATLFGNTYWYPSFLGQQKSFDVTVKVPTPWKSLVQGQMISTQTIGKTQVSRFVEIYPQEDIYLVAGPFFTYDLAMKDGKKVQVLLRKEDPSLAQSFLNLVPDYVEHFSNMISPYPYQSFSVVENFWETGYGMPSFTLLGPSVIRLPFILNSSLPHEILHNWWGNSVYVDYDNGNWSEGLTTYMADYWQQQLAGKEQSYRLNSLISYNDFVGATAEKDFPLRKFQGRHNSSSQAVGYNKAMMFFHMLEFRFGSETFKKALQDFYTANLFKRASFLDIQKSFEKVTAQNLDNLFNQWLDRTGAPEIELLDVKVTTLADGSFRTSYTLSQKQEQTYDLYVPVIWTFATGAELKQVALLNQKALLYTNTTKTRPVKISIDPSFNVFRTLYTAERPATLSAVFGSPLVHFYFDTNSKDATGFVETWKQRLEGKALMHSVADIATPAAKGALVFVGDQEAFSEFMKVQLQEQKFSLDEATITIDDQEFPVASTSTVLMTRLKNNPEQTVVWVRWSKDNNPTEWASRLTHYGNFGILVFQGRPAVLKSTWPVLQSPLQQAL
ncbi:MAG: M1 family peptidase [Bdellovibrio sp.]|nr:M1 family peptidase [Bdellovibrio sp.]